MLPPGGCSRSADDSGLDGAGGCGGVCGPGGGDYQHQSQGPGGGCGH